MNKITPFLWFDNNAEEAMNFYLSIFKNSRVKNVMRNGETVFSVVFELEGQEFMGLNAGPEYKFNEAVSFFVDCKDQGEVDELWKKLSEGGKEGRCGWLKDKFGLSWQIIPSALGDFLGNPDPEKAQQAMRAMMGMGKIDIEGLKQATERR